MTIIIVIVVIMLWFRWFGLLFWQMLLGPLRFCGPGSWKKWVAVKKLKLNYHSRDI